MTWKRSTALPPRASMHARSLPATSRRKFSYFSNALPSAVCRLLATMLATFRSLELYIFAQLLSMVSSGRICSSSSLTARRSWRRLFTRCWTSPSSILVAFSMASTATILAISSFGRRCAPAAESSSAARSTAWTRPSRSFVEASRASPSFASASRLSETRASRDLASSSSRFFLSSGDSFFSLPRSSWRAMPMAVFNCWNLASSTPLAPGATNWWKIRSRFSSGMLKLNSCLEYCKTSVRQRNPSLSLSCFLKRSVVFLEKIVGARILATRSFCAFECLSASCVRRAAAAIRGCAIWSSFADSSRRASASRIVERFCSMKSVQAAQEASAARPACSTALAARRASLSSAAGCLSTAVSGAEVACAFSAAASACVTRRCSSSSSSMAWRSCSFALARRWASSSSACRCCALTCSTYCCA
mmetsp:Transcript_438/g.1156  ORF Transcript_438/g.1156 Transcript_438/m.1156 type:complete len:419 (-) Transcript_438:918-2174(-)